MKFLQLVFALLALSAFALAHDAGEPHEEEACGAPALGEDHKQVGEVALEAAGLLAGIAIAAFGLLRKQQLFTGAGALLALAALVAFFLLAPYEPELLYVGAPNSTHEHADFAVFVEGAQHNFSQAKYMTGGPQTLSGLVHLHGGVGTTLHKHATGVTFAYFLKTFGWKLNETCLSAENEIFCPQQGESDPYGDNLKLFVNGEREKNVLGYSPSDGDKILLVFERHAPSERESQFAAITNYSCIYSHKCAAPEGFIIPGESCSS